MPNFPASSANSEVNLAGEKMFPSEETLGAANWIRQKNMPKSTEVCWARFRRFPPFSAMQDVIEAMSPFWSGQVAVSV